MRCLLCLAARQRTLAGGVGGWNAITSLSLLAIAAVVALINAVLLAIGLSLVGLQFGFLIGLGFAFFGIIPYVGYIICYIPAVLIAFAQFNDWAHPLWVTIIFFLIVAQIDGLLTTPRIVGNSVGLHPMTVIMSVFLWTLVFGGLLGAVLAIPLTATLKVLLHRYV